MKIEKIRLLVHSVTLVIQLFIVFMFQRFLVQTVPTYFTLTGKVIYGISFKGSPLFPDVGYLAVLTLVSFAVGRLSVTMRGRLYGYSPLFTDLLIVFEVWLYFLSWTLVGYLLGYTEIASVFLTIVNVLGLVAVLLCAIRWIQRIKALR